MASFKHSSAVNHGNIVTVFQIKLLIDHPQIDSPIHHCPIQTNESDGTHHPSRCPPEPKPAAQAGSPPIEDNKIREAATMCKWFRVSMVLLSRRGSLLYQSIITLLFAVPASHQPRTPTHGATWWRERVMQGADAHMVGMHAATTNNTSALMSAWKSAWNVFVPTD